MKKVLLGIVGLGAVLTGCGTDLALVDPVKNLNVTGYSTNYQLTTDVRDQNGGTIAAGSDVICDNLSTRVAVDVSWTGGLQQLAIQFKGARTGAAKTVVTDDYGPVDYRGAGSYEYTLMPNMAPQSAKSGLGAQAIVVNPITNVNVKGYTYVRVQGYDVAGNASAISESVTQIPVVDCL
ncbi:hypothetical protein [Deinococcus hopiensis]|uniref:Uncharacterized protein n=1 Tax=Deinococcus hopiensis KR-140 TaxID=695939 RepID=A0A1W1VI96_9DEIO|nr:hypothetical protein [Deinococcus hopiensis]SMB93099.1 hypothetical protein SAMN00790413_01845 [Deinococcus hopiensis KR-140]